MNSKNTFKRAERLKSRKRIEQTFQEGKSKVAYPLRAIWLELDSEAQSSQAAFAVPKRRIKLAVNRNTIKRRIREAYRLNKAELYESLDTQGRRVAVIFHYVGNEELPYDRIEKSIKKLIAIISKQPRI